MRRATPIVSAIVAGLALAACTSTTPPEPSASAAVISDATTCEAFGDVLTITSNADIARDEGRIEQVEHSGWYRLATRVLDRIPTTGEGAVNDVIVALRDAAPPIASGAAAAGGIGSTAWDEALAALLPACQAAGSDLAVEGFTGG